MTATTTTTTTLLAMGDPQAPFQTVRAVLDHHKLTQGDKLKPGARLLSIGDHYDWGGVNERQRAADDGDALLSWLSGHAAEQVVLLAGNHDLARVGELINVDDAEFARLQQLADRHYLGKKHPDDDAAFFNACRFLPSTEMVARDLSTYRASQQALVKQLLLDRRMRLAHAEGGLLFTHAGITRKALVRLGLDDSSPPNEIATALNAALDDAVDTCLRREVALPLGLPGLHRPADGIGEGDGVLYHRPTFVDDDAWLEPRRFDPRRLPRGLWQVVGHVRDRRCVSALKAWSEPKAHVVGVVRHLISEGDKVVYRHGLPPPRASVSPSAAVMIFIDGAMQECPPAQYELLDVAKIV
ncbi:MAG: transcriptional regulator [Deltaproteobacteria bacterium]|nr:transcriptional regulator [Deltaproteobacteria bacterium]